MDIELQSCPGCEPATSLVIPGSEAFDALSDGVGKTIDESGDAAADLSTDAAIESGDQFNGTIDGRNDEDWIAVDLQEGELISASIDAFFGVNLDIYDSSGSLITGVGPAFGSSTEIVFEVPTDETYYVGVSSGLFLQSGDYSLSVGTWDPPELLDALDWGGETVDMGSDNVINVYFAQAGETFDGVTAEGFNAYEISRFMEAFDLYSSVIDVTFNVVNNSADADFKLVGDDGGESAGFYGYFNPPGERNEGVGVFNTSLWDRQAGGDLEYGGFGFVTIMHELGHGMGLAHPHDNGGGSDVMAGVTGPFGSYGIYDLNQGVYTMMSYNDGAPVLEPATSDLWGYQATMMALDVALLQQKYGANTSTATGDDVYEITDLQASGQGWACIWDVSGTDELVYNGSQNSRLDLRAATLEYEYGGGGQLSHVYGVAGGFTIAHGVVIENASGGSGRDRINGNGADNVLKGNGGQDILKSFYGDDTVYGGNGNDVILTGRGADMVWGGHGEDRLVVQNSYESGVTWETRDRFRDFHVDDDVIDLSRIDADTSTEADEAVIFLGNAGFTGSGVTEVRTVDKGDYYWVRIDFDGDGANDMDIHLDTTGTVTVDNFIL